MADRSADGGAAGGRAADGQAADGREADGRAADDGQGRGLGKGLMTRLTKHLSSGGNLGSNSGLRHVRTRGINAFGRRQKDAERQHRVQQMNTDYIERESEHSAYEGMDASHSEEPEAYSDDLVALEVEKATRGRFVSTGSSSGTSKRSRNEVDHSWKVTGPVAGGPENGTVIPSFLGHVAYGIWMEKPRDCIRVQTRNAVWEKLKFWYEELPGEAKQLIQGTDLSHLHTIMFENLDTPLISAFIERWQPDTNTFHMPFGEMTIMLHDVWHILRLPLDGRMIDANPSPSHMQTDCMALMRVGKEVLKKPIWEGGGVKIDSIEELCGPWVRPPQHYESQAIAWFWVMLGSTLFVDKSGGNRVRPSCMQEVKAGFADVRDYSWGSATLAYLYRQLGMASRGDSSGVAGCLTLLQAWIYEYFPDFRPHVPRVVDPKLPRVCMWNVREEAISNDRLHALRRRLDQMIEKEVTWLPYGSNPGSNVPRTLYEGWLLYRDIVEPYMPGRVLRQLGYVQTIPPAIYRPANAVRTWGATKVYKVEFPTVGAVDSWNAFPSHILPLTAHKLATDDPSESDPEYITWYYRHSHPRLLRNVDPLADVPRSNSEYWFHRLINLTRNVITRIQDPEERASYETALAEMMDAFKFAR